MDAARRRLGWRVAGATLLAFVAGAAFSAYLRPDMLLVFGDIMAFCTALLR